MLKSSLFDNHVLIFPCMFVSATMVCSTYHLVSKKAHGDSFSIVNNDLIKSVQSRFMFALLDPVWNGFL